jgi:hypothetical protein
MNHEHHDHAGHGSPSAHASAHGGEGHEAASGGHHGHAGHGGGHGDHVEQFRRLFWIMLVLAIPVVGASGMFAMIIGYELPDVPGLAWISPVIGALMYVWGGRPFLTGAVEELKSRRPGMMLLIALAITVAFLASWGASLGIVDHELDFWWELALLIVIMLLGHWIEMRSLAQTSTALESLAALLPDEAERLDGDDVVTIAAAELRRGDVVIVRPGGRIPADGTVLEGTADLDESMITGESRPVSRGPGDRVVAGTVATDTAIRVQVTAVGDDTALAGIQRLVTEAQASTSRAQRLADTAAAWLFWFALGAGILTAIVWTLLGSPDDAVIRTITVLVIACPHALGLAIPFGGVDRHRTGREGRRADQGPVRAGEHAHRGHGPVRQDRHPHHRHTYSRRNPRSGPRGRRAACRRCGSRGGQRAPVGAGDRGSREAARFHGPEGHRVPGLDRRRCSSAGRWPHGERGRSEHARRASRQAASRVGAVEERGDDHPARARGRAGHRCDRAGG